MSSSDLYVGLTKEAQSFIDKLKEQDNFLVEELIEVCENSEHDSVTGVRVKVKPQNPEKHSQEYYLEEIQAQPYSMGTHTFFTHLRHVAVRHTTKVGEKPVIDDLGVVYAWTEDRNYDSEFDYEKGLFNIH